MEIRMEWSDGTNHAATIQGTTPDMVKTALMSAAMLIDSLPYKTTPRMTPQDIAKDPHWKAMRGVITADLGITHYQVEEVVSRYRQEYGEPKDLESHAKNFLVRKKLEDEP